MILIGFKLKLMAENIKVAKELRSEFLTWDKVDKILISEFESHSRNDDIHIIAYKVELIDKLYNCNLRMDKGLVAKFLKGLNIDEIFEKKTNLISLVKQIANQKLPNYKKRIGIVFASKYCHFSSPHYFPIYDRYAVKALSYLTKKPQSSYQADYTSYKEGIDQLKDSLGLDSYKDIDIYLWLFGQWLLYIERKEKAFKEKKLMNGFSREIIKMFEEKEDLFAKLNPIKE